MTTRPKTPIEQAVAALETIKRTITNKLHATGKTREEYILRFTDQALAALRASTGKMKAANKWIEQQWPVTAFEREEFVRSIQADALASAQPEPRPLPMIGLGPEHIEKVMKEMRVTSTLNVIRWWDAFNNALKPTVTPK